MGSYAHQTGAREDAAFGYRTKIVNFQFDCGDGTRAAQVAVQRDSHGRIRQGREYAAVESLRGILQILAHGAFDGHAVFMDARHPHAQQPVEPEPGGHEFIDLAGG